MGIDPGIKKYTTTYQPPPPGGGLKMRSANSDHPSWIMGLEGLHDFHEWVARVVLPIAFEWIDENYDAVYENIDPANRDDVGVVISAAYQLIQQRQAFQDSLALPEKIACGEVPEPDPAKINPIWATITREVRVATAGAFERERQYLDDTMPPPHTDPPPGPDPDAA